MTTMRTNSAWLSGAMLIAMILVVFSVDTAHAQGFDFDERFPDNDAYESRIKRIDAACLPDPLPLVEHPFGYRLAEGLINECVTENMTLKQAIKYSLLGLTCVFGGPAAPAAAGYTTGELSTDGMKCVLKAFVSASADMDDSEKSSSKFWIDTGFTLKDWKDFTENVSKVYEKIPELQNRGDLMKLEAAVEAGAAAFERTGEAWDFMVALSDGSVSDAAAGAASGAAEVGGEVYAWATTEISDLVYGGAATLMSESEQAMRDCRFDEATEILEDAIKAAQEECHGYGMEYRVAEVEFRSFIYQNRISLGQNNALFDGRFERNPQQDRYPYMEDRVSWKRKRLMDFTETFLEIESLRRTIRVKRGDFDFARSDFERAYGSAISRMDAGGGQEACYSILESIQTLDAITTGLTQGCRDKLFAENNQRVDGPDDIFMQFANSGRVRSQGWWAELDRIREAFAACDTSAAEARSAALMADIAELTPYS